MSFRHGSLFRLELASIAVCLSSVAIAIGMLVAFSIPVEAQSCLVALGMMAFLGGSYIVYGVWRPAPTLSHLCGALGVIACTGGMAGIVSLIGLRYGAPLIDGQLAGLDHALGVETPNVLRVVAAHPFWSRLLGIAYEGSFPLLGGTLIMLAVTRRFEQLWTLAFVFAATVLACTMVSVFVPARGAFAHFGYPAEIIDRLPAGAGTYHLTKFDYYRQHPNPFISFAQLQGVVTFPSFHCCLALMTIAACRGVRLLAQASLAWNVLVIVSTLPVGGHYAIDLPAGTALWLVATAAAVPFCDSPAFRSSGVRWPEIPMPPTAFQVAAA
jgi:hypothetical protein